MIFTLFLFFVNIIKIFSYNDFFNYWHCIGIKENINLKKPFTTNIGDIPLVVWYGENSKKFLSTLNICRHMGSKLDNGKILNNDNLQCMYHGLEHGCSYTFGNIIEHEGKIFWSYKPKSHLPYKIPFFNNKKYSKSFIEVVMDCSLEDSVYNTMDLRHPEYVHNKIVGFGNSVPPQNIKQYKYSNNTIGLSFDYETNKLIKNVIIKDKNSKSTKNFHMFNYPNSGWSRVSFDGDKNIIIGINLLPISRNKTKWYITILNNYQTSFLGNQFVKIMAATILSQDFLQMLNQSDENALKKKLLFSHIFENEEIILYLKEMMQGYKYPDITDITNLNI